MTTFRRLLPAVLLVLGAVFAGCNGDDNNNGGGGGTPNSTIEIVPGAFNKGMMAFSPASDTVHVNDVVRMHNSDSVTHNIQADNGTFPVWGGLPGNTGSNVTATAAGTFGYHCIVSGHSMQGTLVVLP
jgi:plastocyanin